jgi:hypothetical protein
MDLERLSVKLRQRNPWEAIDLGFAMTREWWRVIYGVWLVVIFPVSIVLLLALKPAWALFALWWLEPALDRVVLHSLSSAVFGTHPRWRAALRAYPSYARNGLLASLVWGRLSMLRSFVLPVRQLEGARGREGRQRIAQLKKRARQHAVYLTFACSLFELAALLSLIGLYVLLIPSSEQSLSRTFDWYRTLDDTQQETILVALWMAAMAMIEPFYVAGGFALYLNRRTMLEGWDLEVELRRVAAPASEPASAAPSVAAAWFALVCPCVVLASAWAQPSLAQPAQSEAQKKAKEVLHDPVFGGYEERLRIEPLEPESPKPKSPELDLRGIARIMGAIAEAMRIAVWVVLAAALAFAVYWLARNLRFGTARAPPPARAPDLLFGLDVRPESLPKDIAAAAGKHIARGELIAALSLLYRGALVSLLHHDGIELASGDTEADCIAKARPRVPTNTHDYLTSLVRAWQSAAYAHRAPAAADVQNLASQWRSVFGNATSA